MKHTKVALLISGQPRFVRSSAYKSIKEYILDKYDCDVFCHFWWNPNGGTYITAPWSTLGNMPIPTNAEQDIIELYSPKKIKWDLPLDPNNIKKIYQRSYHPTSSYNLPSMYLSMKKSYELMEEYIQETGIQYNFVIRLRYDAIFTAFPDLTKLPSSYLYAPDYSQYHRLIGNNGLIMPPLIAKIIMRIYDYMDIVYDTGAVFNDENLLTALVTMNKIPHQILSKNEFYIELCRKDI